MRRLLPLLLLALGSTTFAADESPPVAVAAPAKVDIDFSCVGYGRGIPNYYHQAAAFRVRPSGGDDTALLQAALDAFALRPADRDGFRGALVLEAGTFHVSGQLHLKVDGIELRGCGDKTHLIATGKDRRALIRIGGDAPPTTGAEILVTDERIPAGGTVLTLTDATTFQVGDRVVVRRPSTKDWIAALGMDKWEGSFTPIRLEWLPGSMDLRWDRVVTAVDLAHHQLTLDAPITTALEQRFGGGTVAEVTGNKPVREISLINLILVSEYDLANHFDEEHSWIGVQIDNAEDVAIVFLTARHFAGSAVRIGPRARRISVHGCRSQAPISEIADYRRQSFLVEGQQVHVDFCLTQAGLNDFAVGQRAAGPNVFSFCLAEGALGPSGTSESWASGILYDAVRIEGAALKLAKDDTRAQGAGWTAVNSIIRDCKAAEIVAQGPVSAPVIVETTVAGQRLESNDPPMSGASAEPPIASDLSIPEFRLPPSAESPVIPPPVASPVLEIIHGRFVVDGRVVWGGSVNTAWWKGRINPEIAADYGRSPTRWVPGRSGPGLTEELPELAAWMQARGTPFFQHWPGLWYDRRRDDHLRVDRTDSNCWAPFYEMPWARSGQGTAADGLSRYDLTTFNPWYFARLREFARLCGERGLVLYHNLYNTHNVLETGAHWADFPWRPANNINATPLPEPPPLDAKGGVHLANEFFDAASPALRALHRAFILHSLDQLGDQPNVIHGLAFQYAGPLSFQQFFQDTVFEWEQAHGRRLRLALMTGKNVTDAILADPVRAAQIAVIDQRYWQYRPDGSLWAPEAGQNLAFREMNAAKWGKAGGDTPPPTTPEMVYRQVREYRDRFPDKAIVAHDSGCGPIPILMAGGAQALTSTPVGSRAQDWSVFDEFVNRQLGTVLTDMLPRDGWLDDPERNWALADDSGTTVLLSSLDGPALALVRDLPLPSYTAQWFNPRTGEATSADIPNKWTGRISLPKPTADSWLLLLRKHD